MRRTEERRVRQQWVGVIVVLGLLVCLALLAACAAGSPGGSASATATTASTGGTGGATTSTTTSGSPTPTFTPQSGQGNQAGVADICTATPSVKIALPANVPSFPGSTLILAENIGGNDEVGFCATAAASAVVSYYQQQIPTKGWSQVSTFTSNGSTSLLATKGASSSSTLTVTISPDTINTNQVDILVIVNNP
ncbi:MAG: hypothetical protein ABI068_05425 [Ktedonobacterales bacterium]